MGRRKKADLDLDLDVQEPAMAMAVAQPEPVPVRMVQEHRPNPDIGKFPFDDEELPSRRYRFTYNQQPGTPMEFTRGVTVLDRRTGRRKTRYYDFAIDDGEDVEIPTEIAEFMMGLMYFDEGRTRPRCTLVPIQ